MTGWAPSPHDDKRLGLLARAWETDRAGALTRLLDHFESADRDAPVPLADRVRIHVSYEGHRVEALFDPTSDRVEIVNGGLAGRSYRTPSGAAVAVVRALNDTINPNRNGWSFWTITETGSRLGALRRDR